MAAEKAMQESQETVTADRENLWASVLAEVQTNRNSQLPASKNLLVLGDKESGKTTLIAKIQGNEDPKKGAGLEYCYVDVRDEYRDDMTNEEFLEFWLIPPWEHTRLGVWTLDGDDHHQSLLRFALKESNFTETTAVVTASMTSPWDLMDRLRAWASALQDHVDSLDLGAERTKRLQNENIRRWQSYVEPGDELEGGGGDGEDSAQSPNKRISRNMELLESPGGGGGGPGGTLAAEDEEELLPLPEGTLARNLGLDLIVVITKTDYMADLERDYDYKEEHFDFIQQSVRKFCLQYGAALFYTSVKEDKNCDVLYKYLVHRIYGFPFKTPALVVEKDAVFIPAGWDNEKKIAILYENMHSVKPDQYYTDVIARPIVRKVGASNRDLEVMAEDEQQFLLRQQQYLQQGAPAGSMGPGGAGGGGGGLMPATVQKAPDRKSIGSPGVQGSPKKMDAGKPGSVGAVGAAAGAGGVAAEGVLASFFNSLLSKKTGVGASPGGAPGGVPGQPGVGVGVGGVPGGMSPAAGGAGGSPAAAAAGATQIKSPAGEDFKAASAMRSDAAAELDRMTRGAQKKPVDNSGGGGSANNSINNNSSDC